VDEFDKQYGISEKASATSRSINDQWEKLDTSYGISRNSAAVGETFSEWGNTVAEGIQNTLQTPAVQSTLNTVSEWTNNIGRSIGSFLQPAADTVTREINEIKETSTREINQKQRERAKNDDVEMKDLGEKKQPPSADPEAHPSPNVEHIPPPQSASDDV